MRVFLLWKRRCADIRAGTQAPPLQFRLDGLCAERLMPFGWITRGWFCLFVEKTVHMNQHHRCFTFDSPGLIERSKIYPG